MNDLKQLLLTFCMMSSARSYRICTRRSVDQVGATATMRSLATTIGIVLTGIGTSLTNAV
jgi:hypothetical protein